MVYLYFVRHGQTEWNVAKKIQGRQNSQLTAQGIEDAKRLGDRFKDVPWKAIYSSPSGRALQTARLICGSDTFQQDRRLMEMHLGPLEGKTMEEIKQIDDEQYHFYWHQPSKFAYPACERFHQVQSRVQDFLDDMLHIYREGSILVVTHG